MKKALWICVCTILIVGILVYLLEPKRRPSNQQSGPSPSGGPPATSPDSTVQGPPLRKLPILDRVPDFSFTDETGEPFGLDQLQGRAWFVLFGRSNQAAPDQQMAEMLSQLGMLMRDGFPSENVYVVHIASTAPAAEDAKKSASIDGVKFLHGTPEQVGKLREVLFKNSAEQKKSAAEASPSQLALVDPQGYMRASYDGMSAYARPAMQRDARTAMDERVVLIPSLISPPWLEQRRAAQFENREKSEVDSNFSFRDMVKESGIHFRHRVVDDAGRQLITAHYDHGNGLAVADVDKDGLLDIFFVNQVGSSELWRNLGQGRFEDITQAAGLRVTDRISVTASFADIDNDGDADLYVTTVRSGNLLYENDGTGKFKDVSDSSGLGHKGHSSAAVFFDYDRDGLLDLFLVNVGYYTTEKSVVVENDSFTGPDREPHPYYVSNPDAFAAHLKPDRAEQKRLFHNQGNNRFEDVTEAMKLVDLSWSGDASPLDGNQDGWPDLYLTNMQGHDEYYENVGGKEFRKRSRELFPATPWGSMGIKVFDFDNDQKLDLFVTDMHTDMAQDLSPSQEKMKIPKTAFDPKLLATDMNHVWGNAFFHNEGPDKYKEISEEINAENYWPWGLSVGDLNADGFEDVFITSCMNFPYRYAINSVRLNNHGRQFVDSEFVLGIEPRRGGRTAIPWFELDATAKDEGHPVVKSVRSKGMNLARIVVWGALGSRSSAIFDLDNDGDLDVVTNDFNSEPMVLVSNLAERNAKLHFLKIKLTGARSNRSGLGAVVRVKAGSSTFTKVHDGKSGYLSQSDYPLYFGLGEHDQVDQIEVDWPSGQKQVVPGPVKLGQIVEITEPKME